MYISSTSSPPCNRPCNPFRSLTFGKESNICSGDEECTCCLRVSQRMLVLFLYAVHLLLCTLHAIQRRSTLTFRSASLIISDISRITSPESSKFPRSGGSMEFHGIVLLLVLPWNFPWNVWRSSMETRLKFLGKNKRTITIIKIFGPPELLLWPVVVRPQ